MVNKWLKFSLSTLYPHYCSLCGTPGETPLCVGCNRDIPVVLNPCLRCGTGLALVADSLVCGECLSHPPVYQRLISPYAYQPPVSDLITALKYQRRLSLLPVLGEAIVDRVIGTNTVDALLPVPLHASRVRERGFNQSLELARYLAGRLQLPVVQYVERHKATVNQTSLPSSLRKSNIRGAFRLREPVPWQRIAIIDDVVTTGSTVNEIARLLASAGVAVIEVWCIARAI